MVRTKKYYPTEQTFHCEPGLENCTANVKGNLNYVNDYSHLFSYMFTLKAAFLYINQKFSSLNCVTT